MSSDNITEVFPEYLKTVKGLKNTKNRSLNGRIEEYNFRVIEKIQNIIKRINKEDKEKLSDLLKSKKE
jgi:phosphopantothenate synthetase